MQRALAKGLAIAACASAIAVGAACGTDPVTGYGNPNTLARGNLPGGDDGGGIGPIACGDAGLPTTDAGGGCAVSFRQHIYPQVKSDGNWKCAKSGCHAPGGTKPDIDETTPQAAYDSLRATEPIGGNIPYINLASKDPAQSGIFCNCASRTCGSPMPKETTGVKALTVTEICILDAWIKCGSPFN
jgi:hypothetical protein